MKPSEIEWMPNAKTIVAVPKPKCQTKKDRTKMKKKCIELAKKITRLKGVCEKCGRSDRQLHGAHVLSVRHELTAADLDNIICLCAWCHKFSPDSWHEEPLENADWFNSKWPGRYEQLLKKANGPKEIIDWERIHAELKVVLKEYQENPLILESFANESSI